MSNLGWPRRGFLSLLDLDHPGATDDTPYTAELAEAGIDPRTGGAVAVATKAELDGKDGLTHLKTNYWRMLPSGEQLSEELFDIEFEAKESTGLAADGNPAQIPMLVPRTVWVLGRKLYDAADDGDLSPEENERGTTQGLMRNLSRVMMAAGEVNRQMRDGKLPEVAKIFEECAVHDAVGERLLLTGQSPKGGFDFSAADSRGARVNAPLTVPDIVARALMGFGVNTLDAHQRLRSKPVQATAPDTGTVFAAKAEFDEGENPQVAVSTEPTSVFSEKPTYSIPRLSNVAWKSDGAGKSTLVGLHIRDTDLANEDLLTRMRGLGITNRILHDMRNRRYPAAMDHLVEYNLYHLAQDLEPPPPLAEGGRLTMISVGGNNMEEIAEGFGETIGGNSKVICHEGVDKDGKIDRVGVIIDLGLHLSPKDEANISAAPDVIEHLKYCNDILITHRHLDHTDGLFAYIQYGYLKGKTVHATPEVIRAIRDKLRTYPSIHQDDLPTFAPLVGSYAQRVKTFYEEAIATLNSPEEKMATQQAFNQVLGRIGLSEPRIEALDNREEFFRTMRKLKEKLSASYPDAEDEFEAFLQEVQEQLPDAHPLKTYRGPANDGWLHLKDKEGKTRLSVNYARNATPHSARCTPFIVHGHYEGKWIGSYLNPGDSRFGRHNGEGYDGTPVDGDPLNKEFFTGSNRRLLEEINKPEAVYKLDEKIADRRPTYFDLDTTSISRQGWAPTEAEVEKNLTEVSDWFSDKGMLLSMISTNDNRFETALRAATRTDRDLTIFGSNLEKTATTANVLGVNDLRHEPGPRNNNQLYLDWYFKQQVEQKLEKLEAKKQGATDKELRKVERHIQMQQARLEAFEKLAARPHKFIRYQTRNQMEAALEDLYGKKLTLGSVQVSRTSKTSSAIMAGEDGRRLVMLTGTQGTHVEVDAALTALSEGRSLMDGSPNNSHTARPVKPENNVVVISQTAIPGNEEKQNELVRKLASRGFAVIQATHDGFKIHNLDEARRELIIKRLKKLGKGYQKATDGSLSVFGMALHAGGHGHKEDCRAWVKMVNADVTAPQHTADEEVPERLGELCRDEGCRYMDRVVPNFEAVSIRANESAETAEIRSIGHIPPSLIRIRTVRKTRQYHSGHIEATQLVNQGGDSGFRSDGLRATTRPGGVYETAFATVDAETEAKARSARNPGRPEPVPENRMAPPDERPDRGPLYPGKDFRHRLLGQQAENQPAAFVRR